MAAYTSILLLAALCIGTVNSLKCYTCTTETSNSNCKTVTNCDSYSSYCETSVTSTSINGYSGTYISKACATTCTALSYSNSLGSVSTSCCSTDLCNTSGAISIKSSYSAIFLVLGTIVMLVSGSLL